MRNAKILLLAFIFSLLFGLSALSSQVMAQTPPATTDSSQSSTTSTQQNQCAGVNTSIINCNATEANPGDAIMELLKWVVNILSAGVVIVAIGVMVYAGFLYTTSAGSPEQTKKALNLIRDAVIGLIAFGAMYILLNWLVPGGVSVL